MEEDGLRADDELAVALRAPKPRPGLAAPPRLRLVKGYRARPIGNGCPLPHRLGGWRLHDLGN